MRKYEVKFWGPRACFTRLETPVDRVSYQVITPSAARNMLQAIFWKPEFQWRVHDIKVLKPLKHFSIVNNEIKDIARPDRVINAQESRTQRHSLGLKDVAYVISCSQVVQRGLSARKYSEMFLDRVMYGKCIEQPYFGFREYAAFFSFAGPSDKPVDWTDDLGRILFDIDHRKGGARPVLFNARIKNGVVHVPQHLYDEVPCLCC